MQHDSPDGILSGIRCEWAAQYRLKRCRFTHITRPWFMSRLSMIGDMVEFNLRPIIHELLRTRQYIGRNQSTMRRASSGPGPGRSLIRQLFFGAKEVVGTMLFDSLTPKPPQQDPPCETQSDCERAKVQATEAHCRSRQIVRKHCLNRHPTPSTLVHSETRVRRLRAPVERGGVAYASSRSRSSRWLAAGLRPGLPLRVPPSCKGM
jgi:hypothetical protein